MISRFFQGLRGKLILTYTIGDRPGAAGAGDHGPFLGLCFSQRESTDTRAYLSDVVLRPARRPALTCSPVREDLPGLQAWLQETYDTGYASLPPQGMFDSPAAPIFKERPDVRALPGRDRPGSRPARQKAWSGRKYSPPSKWLRSQDILDNALHTGLQSGNCICGHTRWELPDGRAGHAKAGDEGPLVGVIVLTVKAPPPRDRADVCGRCSWDCAGHRLHPAARRSRRLAPCLA